MCSLAECHITLSALRISGCSFTTSLAGLGVVGTFSKLFVAYLGLESLQTSVFSLSSSQIQLTEICKINVNGFIKNSR